MTRTLYVAAIIITAIVGLVFSERAVRAAVSYTGQGNVAFDSITVGKAGVGGVTYFNGTIVNQTTSGAVNNPVTIADNVRIDGRVYRGANMGTSDALPFIIDDNVTITGNLSVNGSAPITIAAKCAAGESVYYTGLSWNCTKPLYDPGPNNVLYLQRSTQGKALSIYNNSDVQTYLQLDTLAPSDSPSSSGCPSDASGIGNMIVQPYSFSSTGIKLFVCVAGGWKSFTPDP